MSRMLRRYDYSLSLFLPLSEQAEEEHLYQCSESDGGQQVAVKHTFSSCTVS